MTKSFFLNEKQALKQLIYCEYSCTGGPLVNDVAFRYLCRKHGIDLPELPGLDGRA